jgi:hypothetical protein
MELEWEGGGGKSRLKPAAARIGRPTISRVEYLEGVIGFCSEGVIPKSRECRMWHWPESGTVVQEFDIWLRFSNLLIPKGAIHVEKTRR